MKPDDKWESRLETAYSEMFIKILEAEAEIDRLAGIYYKGKTEIPFIKTRPKGLLSLKEKIKRKLNSENKEIINLLSQESSIINLFVDKNGITDIVGLRLIFLRFPNNEAVRVDFITNFLIAEYGFKATVLDDPKNGQSGYKAFHFKLQFPKKYGGINLEIQCMGIVQYLWMESEHDLIYKQKQSLPDEQLTYMKELYSHLSGVLQEIENILFLAWK